MGFLTASIQTLNFSKHTFFINLIKFYYTLLHSIKFYSISCAFVSAESPGGGRWRFPILTTGPSWKPALLRSRGAGGLVDFVAVALGGPEIYKASPQDRPAANRGSGQQDPSWLSTG